jgi:putative transposase
LKIVYEHVIRDESELHAIREYIRHNPLDWNQDEENPAR